MNIPKHIIEKAIEGGWEPAYEFFGIEKPLKECDPDLITFYCSKYPEKVLLMSSFWQALGKALGWDAFLRHKPELGASVTSEAMFEKGCRLISYEARGKGGGFANIECEGKKYKHGLETLRVTGKSYWYWHAMANDFYDLILTGGDTEKFWDELAPKP